MLCGKRLSCTSRDDLAANGVGINLSLDKYLLPVLLHNKELPPSYNIHGIQTDRQINFIITDIIS